MAVVDELIREEAGTLSFGNYEIKQKTKKDGFNFNGDIYKIKTFNEITKLERNGMFVYESVPGSTVTDFTADGKEVSFSVEAAKDIGFTEEEVFLLCERFGVER